MGLSLGVPGKAISLSGRFSTGGKLCVIVAALMGKHRGLPDYSDPIIDFDYFFLKDVLRGHVDVGGNDVSHNGLLKSIMGDNESNSRSSIITTDSNAIKGVNDL